MAMNVGPRRPAMTEINVTPLIDVMLVLLVIFMVATPRAQHGLDSALPRTPVSPAPRREPAPVLAVEEAGLTLDGVPIPSQEALAERLRSEFAARADHTLFVRAAGALSYGRVVDVLDVARGAGAERLGLLPAAKGVRP